MSDTTQLPGTITLFECSGLLHCSEKTILRWVKENKFPKPLSRVGNRYLFSRADILAFLHKGNRRG
jgi:excisionase family DNA binding protein